MRPIATLILPLVVAFAAGCAEEPAATPTDSAGMAGANQAAGPASSAPASAPTAPTKVDPKNYTTTASGLKYAILKPGQGEPAKSHQQVSVHYTGWLHDGGKKFDSSLDGGEPFSFTIDHGDVIRGWDEGVRGMKVGERRQLVIPSKLGYRETGTPDGTIPPNATLIFEVELVRLGEGHEH